MTERDHTATRGAELLAAARHQGWPARLRLYMRLVGPGWFQSAIMLGGGSLAGSLYLGVLSGYSLIWLQPFAMLLTVIMMSGLGYVVLSTGQRPFQAINRHINPVLGWGWALAALASCLVWAMPQYALAAGVLQQTLAPSLLGAGGPLGDTGGKLAISASILALLLAMTWNYGRGGAATRLFERMVKLFVGLIVICFLGVVIRLAAAPQGLDWPAVWRGLVPDFSLFFRPSDGFSRLLDGVPEDAARFWREVIVTRQRDVMLAVAAAASGVNATFLFAYSLVERRWGKPFRGFVVFDLTTGMLLPFAIATSCVVVAAASQFHLVPHAGLVDVPGVVSTPVEQRQRQEYEQLLRQRALGGTQPSLSPAARGGADRGVSAADRHLAATLVTRDAFDLAAVLKPLTGDFFARIIFSLGVLGMTLSSILLHMLISGMVICEILGRPHRGWPLRLGSLAATTGLLGPFLWDRAAFWVAVPTSVFNFLLLPVAYLTFFLLMNQRSLLGDDMPTGAARWIWNLLMGGVVLLVTAASLYMLWDKAGVAGIGVAVVFGLAVLVAHVYRRSKPLVVPQTSGVSAAHDEAK